MTFLDKAYWLYKAGDPIRRAVRGSGLEAFFAEQRAPSWTTPEGFQTVAAVSLSAAGDLMSHAWLTRSKGMLYTPAVQDVVFGADVPMANLECAVHEAGGPLRTDGKTGPPLSFDEDALDVVTSSRGRRYAFLAAACNHSLDYGEQGVRSTIQALREREIAFHGINAREEDADCATILESNGVRLGLVSYCFGLNARRPPKDRPRIVNRMALNAPPQHVDFAQLRAQLRHCCDAQVDFVIAQLHWGMEFELYPRPEQVELAHHLAEMGIDTVVGHHPHVLQPVEYYRTRRDPARVVPIYYSLGNLTNPFLAPFMCRSGIARIDLVKGTVGNVSRTYPRRADVIAVDQVTDTRRGTIALRAVSP